MKLTLIIVSAIFIANTYASQALIDALKKVLQDIESPPVVKASNEFKTEALATRHTAPNLIFERIANFYTADNVIELRVHLNLLEIWPACIQIEENINSVKEIDFRFSQEYYMRNQEVNRAQNRLKEACGFVTLFKDYATSVPRHRRWLQLAVPLAGTVASTVFGAWQTYNFNSKAAHVEKRVDRVMELQQKQLFTLEEVVKDVMNLTKTMEGIHNKLTLTDSIQKFMWTMNNINRDIDKVKDIQQAFTNTLSGLASNKLTMDLVSIEKLQTIYTKLGEFAKQKGTLLLQHPMDILQFPAKFDLKTNGTLNISLFVPVQHKTFQLYLYTPFPFYVPNIDESYIISHPEAKNYFITAKEGVLSAELSKEEIDQECISYKDSYICLGIEIFSTKPENTCLGSLHYSNFDENRCQLERFTDPYKIVKYSPNKFLTYSRDPIQAKIECPNQQENAIVLHNQNIIEIPENCFLKSGEFFVKPSDTEALSQTIILDLTKDPSFFLPVNVSFAEYNEVQRQFQVTSLKGTAAEMRTRYSKLLNDLHKIQNNARGADSKISSIEGYTSISSTTDFWHTVVIAIIVSIVTIVCVLIVVLGIKVSKRIKKFKSSMSRIVPCISPEITDDDDDDTPYTKPQSELKDMAKP